MKPAKEKQATLSEQLETLFDEYSTKSILIAISIVLEKRVKENKSLHPQMAWLTHKVYELIDLFIEDIQQ